MSDAPDLFTLIKSLSSNEKRNFKLFTQSNSNTKTKSYIELFDELDKMKTYDEKILIKQFKNKNKLAQLHPMKSYLFKVIMKSLTNYHSERSSNYS